MLGPADRIENVLEALLVETGARQEFEPYTPPDVTFEGRVDLRELTTLTIDPETAKDFDDALSIDDDRAYVHIADVSYFVDADSPLDRGAAQRGFSTYVPGLVAPMLPPELADDLCSLRPHVDRLCVTVELPLNDARAVVLPLRHPQRRAAVVRTGTADPLGLRVVRPRRRRSRRLDERARELRRRRFARGALRIQTPEVVFDFDGRGGVAGAHREGEPEAHALVEEFMIAANEAVAGLLSSRNRAALYRVHERPDPQSVQLLLAKLAELEVPTPPAPERAHAVERRRGRGGRGGAGRDVRRAIGPRTRRVPGARASRAEAGTLRPAQPRPLGPREPRIQPLHVADPPLPRPRVPPRTTARARRRGRSTARRTRRARRALVSARARGRAGRVSRRRDLPRVAARLRPLRAGLGGALRGRDRRRDRLGPLRPLRRRVRGASCRHVGCQATTSRRRRSAPRSPGGAAAGRSGSATRSTCASNGSNARPAGSKSRPSNLGQWP